MNAHEKQELYLDVIGFLRSACAELTGVVDAGAKYYPVELRREALEFVAATRAVMSKVNAVLELAGGAIDAPIEEEDEPEWYDAQGRPCPHGCYDAGGHYYAERDRGIDRDCE